MLISGCGDCSSAFLLARERESGIDVDIQDTSVRTR